VVVTTGAIKCAKLQSNHHHRPTDQHPMFYSPDALLVTQPAVSQHESMRNNMMLEMSVVLVLN